MSPYSDLGLLYVLDIGLHLFFYSSQDNWGFKCIGAMGGPKPKLVVDDENTIKEVEEPFVSTQENELIKKLK